jgi:hypothetical protein
MVEVNYYRFAGGFETVTQSTMSIATPPSERIRRADPRSPTRAGAGQLIDMKYWRC